MSGVILNMTVVPLLGWTWMFSILGLLACISLGMLYYFTELRVTFYPYDEDRPLYNEVHSPDDF